MIRKCLDAPVAALKILLGLNMLLSLVLTFVNVLLRTAGTDTIEWVEPLVIYLIMWTVFLGAGLIFSDDEHLTMGLIYDCLPSVWKKVLDVLNGVLTIAASLFLMYFGFLVTRNLYLLGQTSTDGHIPLYLVMLSIPVGGAVTIYCMIANWIKRWETLRQKGGEAS